MTRTASAPHRRWTFRLGSVSGIEIDVHATFLFLLAWICIHPLIRGDGLPVALHGSLLLVSMFAIVVLHELGHALTAGHFGIRTRDITLLPIGGVARLDSFPEKPAEEMLVALAGPAVNVVLACGIAAAIVASGGRVEPADLQSVDGSFFAQVFWINVSLAVFNLIPAFPMDGGRVLRAALSLRMDRLRATAIAATIGQRVSLFLGLLGLLLNPMLVLVAVFVWFAAEHESTLEWLKCSLHGSSAASAMVRDFAVVAPDESLGRTADALLPGFQNDFPVVAAGRPVGLLTRDDIVRALAATGRDASVADVMRTDFPTVDESEPLADLLVRLDEREPACLVMRHGRVVGILTPENIGRLVARNVRSGDGPHAQ